MLHKNAQNPKGVRQTLYKTGIAALLSVSGMVYLQSCQVKEGKPDISPAAKQEQAAKSEGPMELMPEPDYDVNKYLAEHIEYPEEAEKNEIEGRVVVKFTIDEEGNIVDPVAVKSPDQSLSDEAIRVVKSMPKWNPGMQDGKNVSVAFTLPIKFTLD